MTTSNKQTNRKFDRNEITTVGGILEWNANHHPTRPALYSEGQMVTYGEWDRRSNQVANGLMALGTRNQARIGYLAKNDIRYFEILMGCAKSNRVVTPIGWRLKLPEILYLLNDFDVTTLFIGEEYADYIPEIRANCTDIDTIVTIEPTPGVDLSFDTWRDSQSPSSVSFSVNPDDVVLQIHTSGTTGRPKGAMLTHSNVLAQAARCLSGELDVWKEDDIVLCALPLFHSGGTCWSLYAPFIGASNYIIRESGSAHIIEAFSHQPITKVGMVPSLIQMVLNDPSFSKEKLKSLGLISYGGSPITVELLRQCIQELSCKFVQMFGMTETCTNGTTLLAEDHDLDRPHLLKSCGRPGKNVEIRIVDTLGNEVPKGQTGEIVIRSASVMKGYYARPEANAEVLRDGYYFTGDAGYFDSEGYLFLRDRIKDMIISGGENIYPAEIEQVLAMHPSIIESAAIGVPSKIWGEEVKVFVVTRPRMKVDEQEIIDHCKRHLASYKCPKTVEFMELLPRNASGKVLKRDLRAPYWD